MANWWDIDNEVEQHKKLIDTFQTIDKNQSSRSQLNLHHLRLYSNRLAMGLNGSDWAVYEHGDKLKLNVVKTIIDAAVAQIASNKTRPMFLTDAGNYKLQKQGKKLGQFCLGQFHSAKQYDLGLDIFRDAAIFGSGFEKIAPNDNEICAERVLPDEIVIDDRESRYGKPYCFYQIKEVDREALIEEYPKFKAQIKLASSLRDMNTWRYDNKKPLHVLEAWRLGCNDKAGKHIITLDNQILSCDDYDKTTFPFAKFDWSTSPIGYYGVGIAEELCSIQVEVNYILQKVQRLMTLATSQVWVEKGASVNLGQLNNDDFAAREFKGRPPIFMTVASVSPEYFSHLDRLWNRAFEIIGVSQMQATAQKPAGLDSGKAIRTYADVSSKRFAHVNQRWEQFGLDVAELFVDSARDIEKSGGKLKTKAINKNGIEELKFSDVDLDKDKYVLRVHPVSFLPDTPAGQMQTIKEFGDINPDIQKQLLSLMDYPDLQGALSHVNAPYDLVDMIIDNILESGEYRPPDAFIPLEWGIARATQALLRGETSNLDNEKLDLLRQWISDAQALLQPPQQPQEQLPQQPQPMPQEQAAQMPEMA